MEKNTLGLGSAPVNERDASSPPHALAGSNESDGIVVEQVVHFTSTPDDDGLSSQLRLNINSSETSTCFGEEDDTAGCLEVEAFIDANKLLEPPASDMAKKKKGAAAAAVLSRSKSDSVVEPPSEAKVELSNMPSSVKSFDGVVPTRDRAHSIGSDRQGSPNSVAGMARPCSPARVMANKSTDSSLSLNESTLSLKDDDMGTAIATNRSSTSKSEDEVASLGIGSPDVSLNKSSSVLDVVLEGESNGSEIIETAGTVVLSDAGESRCTSTAPVINLTTLGDDPDSQKLVALGLLVKASTANSNADPDDSMVGNAGIVANTSGDANTSSLSLEPHADGEVIKTTISSESASIEAASDAKTDPVLGRISPIATVSEARERSKSPRKASISPIPLTNSVYGSNSGYDKKRLNERLKQRLAKRNQMHANDDSPSPTKSTGEENSPLSKSLMDRPKFETRLQAGVRQKRRSKSRAKSIGSNDGDSSAILSKYNASSEVDNAQQGKKVYPDSVTFSDGEEDPSALLVKTKIASRDRRSTYRKCVSEVGVSLSMSSRSSRSKLSRHHHSHHHRIGILQADGIVYDDALLLRLARQARYGRMRGEVSHISDNATGAAGDTRRYNDVKIHVYDLLTKDSLVELPYFNCNFPIGQCFKVVNDGCHVLGTGAYHVGVEVNGVEYAFGANNIIGMSGIFTCLPKESPGYEFRETLDFGQVHTTKRTWIRIPKTGTGTSFKTISEEFSGSNNNDCESKKSDEKKIFSYSPKSPLNDVYSFREIESFADGHAVIHSMAREYMGTDYDLLRKNCCTFAREVCIRLGVNDDKIPKWFHNAAQAGADAEDAITNVENSVRNMLDCAEEGDPLDMECYNHGFEVIIDEKSVMKMKVVESPSMRSHHERRPLSDDLCDSMHETASWTY